MAPASNPHARKEESSKITCTFYFKKNNLKLGLEEQPKRLLLDYYKKDKYISIAVHQSRSNIRSDGKSSYIANIGQPDQRSL